MNPKLKDAVEIFNKLGWRNVDNQNVLTLSLGTEEEQKLALKGLSTGVWVKRGTSATQWQDTFYAFPDERHATEYTRKLLIFAIRLGITSKRMFQLLNMVTPNHALLIKVIIQRGEEFIHEFVNNATSISAEWNAWGSYAVEFAYLYDVPIPENTAYLNDWLDYISRHTRAWQNQRDKWKHITVGGELQKRADFHDKFDTHIRLCAKLGVENNFAYKTVVTYGLEQGLLERQLVLDIAMNALDTSVRPNDRKIWFEVLLSAKVTDEELCQRAGLLNPILASGDNYLINELAPRLIANVDEKDLMETLLSAFSTTTKKGKLLVLKAALKRDLPMNGEELAPWLGIYILDKDGSVSKAAQTLMDKWHLTAEIDTFEETVDTNVWQATPDVWKLPDFELGEVSAERLTELASVIVRRKSEEPLDGDLESERFLAMAVALAYDDEPTAKMALSGVGASWGTLNLIKEWTRGELKSYAIDSNYRVYSPIDGRNQLVLQRLGRVPCLLSTPSRMDLSITLPDLVARIKRFIETETQVVEADFLLALCRLDVTTKTDQLIETIKKIELDVLKAVPIRGTDQVKESKLVDVGQTLLAYLEDPIVESGIVKVENQYGTFDKLTVPKCLDRFPKRLEDSYKKDIDVLTFPNFKTLGFGMLRWQQGYMDHEKGQELMQMAHRGEPLPPYAVANFLATFRSDTTELYWEALKLAWERGLIRPRVADVTLMDGEKDKLISLAALANALELIISEGLLSVVWPMLDDIVKISASAVKIATGTNEIVALMEKYLPVVMKAVEESRAGHVELEVPGLRLLAKKNGKSRGVLMAQEMMALLPTVDTKKEEKQRVLVERKPFDEIWVAYKEKAVIEDWVDIVVEGSGNYVFNLFLPAEPDVKYQICKGWTYDLETEGHSQAVQVPRDVTGYQGAPFHEASYLRWNPELGHLVYEGKREWRKKSKHKERIYPQSLLTVILGIGGQKDDYYVDSLLKTHVKNGNLTPISVRQGIKMLIKSPAYNVGLLLRHLEKSSEFLSVLYPVLVVAVNHAGAQVAGGEKLPKWANRVLDVTLLYGEYLIEAKNRGLIDEADFVWDGLTQIASMKGKSVAKEKAAQLMGIFGV